jgi:hypothetical protein
MRRGKRAGLEVTMDRSRGPGKIGKDASALSASWVPRISHEILRDLGMSDDAIARYFDAPRFQVAQSCYRSGVLAVVWRYASPCVPSSYVGMCGIAERPLAALRPPGGRTSKIDDYAASLRNKPKECAMKLNSVQVEQTLANSRRR